MQNPLFTYTPFKLHSILIIIKCNHAHRKKIRSFARKISALKSLKGIAKSVQCKFRSLLVYLRRIKNTYFAILGTRKLFFVYVRVCLSNLQFNLDSLPDSPYSTFIHERSMQYLMRINMLVWGGGAMEIKIVVTCMSMLCHTCVCQ